MKAKIFVIMELYTRTFIEWEGSFMIVVKEIVNWMIETGCRETTTGAYYISYNEIVKEFCDEQVTEEWLSQHKENIADELDSRPEISMETLADDEGFDMTFYIEHVCKRCNQRKFTTEYCIHNCTLDIESVYD